MSRVSGNLQWQERVWGGTPSNVESVQAIAPSDVENVPRVERSNVECAHRVTPSDVASVGRMVPFNVECVPGALNRLGAFEDPPRHARRYRRPP